MPAGWRPQTDTCELRAASFRESNFASALVYRGCEFYVALEHAHVRVEFARVPKSRGRELNIGLEYIHVVPFWPYM